MRFAQRPLRLFWPSHFRRDLWSLDLPAFQLVIGSSRHAVQHVLVRGAARYPKSRVMKPLLAPLIGQGLFVSAAADVPSIRRMFVRAIAQVDDELIEATTRRLLGDYIRRWPGDGSLARLPVSSEMSRLAVDIVSECLFRTRFSEAESAEFTRLFFLYQQLASPLRLFPWVGKRVFAPLRQFRLRRVAERMRQLMRERFAVAVRQPDSAVASAAFARAIAERERNGEPPLSDERLLDEVAVMLLAGHETSASALSWLLRQLAGDPGLQDRLREEIAQSAEPAAGVAADTTLMKSVINEVLRLYPPIPIYARDATATETIEGQSVRAGALVLISPWVIHRHTQLWDDARTFNPDRFRSSSTNDAAGRFLPFGSGPRACPGSRFAMVEMHAILTGLLQAFRIRPLPGAVAQPLGNLTTRPDREIYVALDSLSRAADEAGQAVAS
ncbi:MAG: cytochrome P450 [Alphaproteobacteria bacterium]|nr:cytochrome P450 [Alphaproteobacteria bacterium]